MEEAAHVAPAFADRQRVRCAQVALVPRSLILLAWEHCQGWVGAALRYSFQHKWTLDDMRARLVSGEFLLMLMSDGDVIEAALDDVKACAIVAKLRDYETGETYIALMAVGGSDAEAWVPALFEALRRMAVGEGCARIVAIGRPGWARHLRPHGCRMSAAVMTYEITAADMGRGLDD